MAADFTIYRGTDFNIYIPVYDTSTPPVQYNLAGATVEWVAVKEPLVGTLTASLIKTTSSGVTIVTEPESNTGITNTLLIAILHTDGSALSLVTYAHEAQVTMGSDVEVVYPTLSKAPATFDVDLSLVAATVGGLHLSREQQEEEKPRHVVLSGARIRRLWDTEGTTDTADTEAGNAQ